MGLFWDLYQQSQISTQGDRTASLADRVDRLEADMRRTQQLLRAVIERLEKQTGTDLDGASASGGSPAFSIRRVLCDHVAVRPAARLARREDGDASPASSCSNGFPRQPRSESRRSRGRAAARRARSTVWRKAGLCPPSAATWSMGPARPEVHRARRRYRTRSSSSSRPNGGNRNQDGLSLKVYNEEDVIAPWMKRGLTHVKMLHTADPKVANTDEFVKPLLDAERACGSTADASGTGGLVRGHAP